MPLKDRKMEVKIQIFKKESKPKERKSKGYGKIQNKQDDVLKPNYINNHIMCKQQRGRDG